MIKKHRVTPSILSSDFSRLGEEVKKLENAGADGFHVDVMDGHFVPNLTVGVPIIQSLRKITSLPLDLHLMVSQPENMIPAFVESGADCITVHIESTSDPSLVLKQIHQYKIQAGIALKPVTKVDSIFPFLEQIDRILIMTVEPGFSGQPLLRDQLEKISIVRRKLQEHGLNIPIQVDGGVNDKTLFDLRLADILVSGKFIFQHTDYRKAILMLQRGEN